MKVLVAGGGSGGHITPVISVTNEILRERPRTSVRFFTDFGFYSKTRKLVEGSPSLARVKLSRIISGKFRRYAHFGVLDYVKHPSIMLSNFLDLIKVGLGFFQSLFKLIFWRPDVVFLKGGFVCLPIGLAARLLRIPIIIHDSDVAAGLTNRILGRFARRVLSGMPDSNLKGAEFVGVPVAAELRGVSARESGSLKTSLGFDPDKPLVLFTGGGLGARRLNEAVAEVLPELKEFTQVFLITGKNSPSSPSIEPLYHTRREKSILIMNNGVKVVDFASNMAEIIMAADLVVARAGATTIAELARAGKPVVLVPNAKLPGRHQVKNAESLRAAGAVAVLPDDDLDKPKELLEMVRGLIKNQKEREVLAENIGKFARPRAAQEIAEIVLEVGGK